jgi:hypothetical protein
MIVKVKFSVNVKETIINLTNFGHLPETKWEELTEDEQHEVEDSARENNVIMVDVSPADEN